MNKRTFLKAGSSALIVYQPIVEMLQRLDTIYGSSSEKELSKNEDYWAEIRKGYKLKTDYINLENGYYCFAPETTLNHFIDHVGEVNYQGSHYM